MLSETTRLVAGGGSTGSAGGAGGGEGGVAGVSLGGGGVPTAAMGNAAPPPPPPPPPQLDMPSTSAQPPTNTNARSVRPSCRIATPRSSVVEKKCRQAPRRQSARANQYSPASECHTSPPLRANQGVAQP